MSGPTRLAPQKEDQEEEAAQSVEAIGFDVHAAATLSAGTDILSSGQDVNTFRDNTTPSSRHRRPVKTVKVSTVPRTDWTCNYRTGFDCTPAQETDLGTLGMRLPSLSTTYTQPDK